MNGSRTEPENYRLISLTSHVVKTMKRVLRNAIVNHMDFHLKLATNQRGSKVGRSTLSQLLLHYDEVLSALETGFNLDIIYLDFLKENDKVDHGILLHKLKYTGKSRIRETSNLSTNADRRTDTILERLRDLSFF